MSSRRAMDLVRAVRAVLGPALAGAVLLALAPPARAEIWGFIDEQGVAHLAAQQVDARYQLFLRDGGQLDTTQGLVLPSAAAPAPGDRPLPSLLAASPGYRQVREHLREAARTYGVDYELLKAVIAAESGFDAAAVSPKGAIGLMQVMPATAARYGVRGDGKTPVARRLADPATNIRTGTRYLRDLIRMFPGQLELALAAYNAGEGAVQRAGNRVPDYRETRNYVRTVLQLYAALKPGATATLQGPGAGADASNPRRVRMQLPGAGAPPPAGRPPRD